jgi:hypothetical protein
VSSIEQEVLLTPVTRTSIIERDGHCCRMCGLWVEVPHVHHVIYRSQGGKDVDANLVSLDWRCHAQVHSNKPLWLPILQQVAITNGVNGVQLLRWYRRCA